MIQSSRLILIQIPILIQISRLPPPTNPAFLIVNHTCSGHQHLCMSLSSPGVTFNPTPYYSPCCWICSLHHISTPNWSRTNSRKRNFSPSLPTLTSLSLCLPFFLFVFFCGLTPSPTSPFPPLPPQYNPRYYLTDEPR